jgi:subtilisin-like proprotein convertase family protein
MTSSNLRTGRRPCSRNILLSAAAAAASLLSSVTMAAVVTSPVTKLSVPQTVGGSYINVVTGVTGGSGAGVAGWDLNPYAGTGATVLNIYWSEISAGVRGGGVAGVAAGPLIVLNEGDTVGPASIFNAAITATSPNFRVTQTGFLGFQFINEGTGQLNYGYMEISTTGPNGYPATISSIFYEDTGAPITIAGADPVLSLGDVGAVDACASLPANNNGIIEPGEIITLTLPLSAANGDFTNVTGMLSSGTAGVTVVSGMGSYGTVADGSTVNASYTVAVDSTVACNSSFDLTLAVSSTEGNASFPISRDVGQTAAFTYNGLPAAIPDNSPGTGGSSTANVSGLPGPITDVSVRVNATHTWVGDLIITLTSPGGTTVTLLDRPGFAGTGFGCSNNNVAVTFADGQADPEGVCTGVSADAWPVANASPVTPLSALDGQDGNGTWTLTVTDSATGDTGNIVDWELFIEPAAAGICNVCPSDPEFGFGTANISFGNVVTGTNSAAQFVTLSNTGDGPGTVDSLTISGPFSIVAGGTCPAAPFPLAAGESCTVAVVFNAGAIGSGLGSLTATGGGDTLVVGLAGNSILPPPAFIPVSSPWALALMIALMGLFAGVFVSRRPS